MAWATIQQVTDQTGKTVSAGDLALASSIIDTYAGTDPAMPETSITARDRAILRKATAWQAVWIGSQPGYLEHRGVDYSPTADGTSGQRKSQADQDLAPLAQRELKNLSWVGTGVVNLRPGRYAPKGALMIDFLNESSDGWYGDYDPGPVVGASSSSGLTGWQEITGKPLVFPPDAHTHEIEDITGLQDALDAAGGGEGGGGPVAWSEITGKPSVFPPDVHSHAYADITGKPSTFTPSAHNHIQGEVTGLSASLAALTPLTTLEGVETALEATDAALGTQITDLTAAVAADVAALQAVDTDLEGRVSNLEGAPGGGGSTLVVRRAIVTSGNITPQNTSGSWAPLTGGPTLSIPAAVGDYVALDIQSLLNEKNAATFYELAILVGGSLVRYGTTDGATPSPEGDAALYNDTNYPRAGLGMDVIVEAGDLSGGNVTFCFAVKSGGSGTLYAGTFYPLRWRALNHGPVG